MCVRDVLMCHAFHSNQVEIYKSSESIELRNNRRMSGPILEEGLSNLTNLGKSNTSM